MNEGTLCGSSGPLECLGRGRHERRKELPFIILLLQALESFSSSANEDYHHPPGQLLEQSTEMPNSSFLYADMTLPFTFHYSIYTHRHYSISFSTLDCEPPEWPSDHTTASDTLWCGLQDWAIQTSMLWGFLFSIFFSKSQQCLFLLNI